MLKLEKRVMLLEKLHSSTRNKYLLLVLIASIVVSSVVAFKVGYKKGTKDAFDFVDDYFRQQQGQAKAQMDRSS